MTRGRPPMRLGHVDGLETDAETKERLKAILATLGGDLSVIEACEQLGLSETRFHELRQESLEGMLERLTPRPPGRPPKPPAEDSELTRLKERYAWLEEELEIARLRTEIAIVDPSLLREPEYIPKKKGSSKKRKRDERRRKDGGRSGT